MPALELHHEVLYNALLAVYTADSNKFSGGSFSKGVRDFVREGDRRTGNLVLPYIEVVIRDERTDSLDRQYVECVATFIIHTNVDQSHSDQDDIASEINRLYHDVSLNSTGTDWKFGRCFVGSMRQLSPNLGPNGKTLRFAVPVKVTGYKTASSGVRQLLGGEGQVTWTEGSGGEDVQAALVEVVGVRVNDTQTLDYRPFGQQWSQPRGLLRGGTVLLRQKIAAGANNAAHIPNGVLAGVVIYADKNNASVNNWAFNARIYRSSWDIAGGEAGGQPQSITYEARIDGKVTETA